MADLLYYLVEKMAGIHDALMTLNDSYETMLSDKELHFIVIGVLGMALLLVIFPLFKALSKHHVLVIAWIYVFTVMVVVTFAIEIGQGITNTGNMEMEDIVSGLAGFMFLFIIFAVLRAIVLGIVHLVRGIMGWDDDDDDDDDEYGEMLDELIDRFGELPKPAANLLLVALIRAEAHAAGVVQLVHKEKETRIYMHERADVDVAAIPDFLAEYGRRIQFKATAKNPYFLVNMNGFKGQGLLLEEKSLVENMLRILCHKELN